VSAYQIKYSNNPVFTSGEALDVLVAMNPAALKVNLKDLRPNGVLIINTDAFTKQNLRLAGYASNPLDDGTLEPFQVIKVELTRLTRVALEEAEIKRRGQKAIDRCKNFFALGITFWLYHRPLEPTLKWIEKKFAGHEDLVEANQLALKGGYNHAYSTELFTVTYEVTPAKFEPGTYRSISGNTAIALGLVTAAELSGLDLVYGTYPITPASDILHELARHKSRGVITFQAEDEIAAVGAALGAAFAGALGATATSGPGMALKSEAIGLAVMTELPLVIIDVQRGGPSTGLPTKTEQSDLLQAVYGRNGESPVAVLAAQSPFDCFSTTLEALRIATRYMTPVIVLTDGGIANATEIGKVPVFEELPPFELKFRTDAVGFEVYGRDGKLARDWVQPGTPGLEHRIGGLEKDARTGEVSMDGLNHDHMVKIRARKIEGIARDYAPLEVEGDEEARLLVIGWGGTYGSIAEAVRHSNAHGYPVAHVHLRHLNPLPDDLADIMQRYENILVPEVNLGQLSVLLRNRYLREVTGFNRVAGKPLKVSELCEAIAGLA
jgi:2-oxoglutarate ferredoxin oxidoreductase subunit alpha